MTAEQYFRIDNVDDITSKFPTESKLGESCGSIFFSESKDTFHDDYAESQDEFKNMIDKYKNKFMTFSSFCGRVKRKQRTAYHCYGIGVDVDANCNKHSLIKLIQNLDTDYPTFIVESESGNNYHFLFLFNEPVRVTKENKSNINNNIKLIQNYLSEKIDEEFEKTLGKNNVTDKEACGSERYWSNPFNSENRLSYHSENYIDFEYLKSKAENFIFSEEDEKVEYDLDVPRKKHYGIAGYNTVNPFKLMQNIPEGSRHNTIKKRTILSNALGFPENKTLSYAKTWWDERQKDKNDMDWNEVKRVVIDCYDNKYLKKGNEFWKVYDDLLDYYTTRKPLKRRDYLHKEEAIWAVLEFLRKNENKVDVSSWKDLREKASNQLPDYAPHISETTFYRIKQIIINKSIIGFTKHKSKINVRFYPSNMKLIGIKNLKSPDTVYMRMRINDKNVVNDSCDTSNSCTFLVCDLKDLAVGEVENNKTVKIEKGFQTLYKNDWVIIEEKPEKSNKSVG